MYKFM